RIRSILERSWHPCTGCLPLPPLFPIQSLILERCRLSSLSLHSTPENISPSIRRLPIVSLERQITLSRQDFLCHKALERLRILPGSVMIHGINPSSSCEVKHG